MSVNVFQKVLWVPKKLDMTWAYTKHITFSYTSWVGLGCVEALLGLLSYDHFRSWIMQTLTLLIILIKKSLMKWIMSKTFYFKDFIFLEVIRYSLEFETSWKILNLCLKFLLFWMSVIQLILHTKCEILQCTKCGIKKLKNGFR
jgi:hypothetical protein